MPMTIEPKMNHTEGSMKSLKATLGSRMRNNAWTTAMSTLVTPIGTTSKTHQREAKRNNPIAALPSGERGKALPAGSMASGQEGEK